MSRRDVLVLCYHGVRPTATTRLEVSVDALARQLESLLARGYRGSSFADAVLAPPWRRTLAVTFDDGERVVDTHARPVLDALRIPGTVFVSTGLIGGYDLLTWDELRGLAAAGWEIGSHGRSHLPLPGLGDAELRLELVEPLERLESELGTRCRSLAYPFGAADARVAAAANAAGYQAACVLGGGGPRDRLHWPRVGVGSADGMLAFRVKTAPAVRAFRGSRAAPVVERALRRLSCRRASGRRRAARPG